MNEDFFKNSPKQEKLAIRVEIATEKDWEAYKKIRLEAYTGPDGGMFGATPGKIEKEQMRSAEDWKNDLSRDDVFVVLSWSGQEAVGMGVAEKKNEQEKFWHIRSGYVKENFRGQDIQKKMITKRLEEIRRRGGRKVQLAVKTANTISIHNAELFGFKKVDRGASAEGFFMELDLEPQK
jgi:ribosomal protein S18 acetylase RimI-like enzyme